MANDRVVYLIEHCVWLQNKARLISIQEEQNIDIMMFIGNAMIYEMIRYVAKIHLASTDGVKQNQH